LAVKTAAAPGAASEMMDQRTTQKNGLNNDATPQILHVFCCQVNFIGNQSSP
jgi:hypothetical protein